LGIKARIFAGGINSGGYRSTNSQISLKPEGDVFVAGSDRALQLLALCHAAVSDTWYLVGRFRELIAYATRN
jgi:hypothetical protein